MLAFVLCLTTMWRVVLVASIAVALIHFGGWVAEHLIIDVTNRSGLSRATQLLPVALEEVRTMFFFYATLIYVVALGSICNAYRVYRILYPKFARGGRDAIAFYWWHTSHHGGCPAAGFRVAVVLALWHTKR
jgi:hypothetical protein